MSITGDQQRKLEDSLPLDDMSLEISDEEFLADEVKKFVKERDQIRGRVAKRLREAGKSYGTIGGRLVVRYKATDGYAIKKMIEENEVETAPYMVERVVTELDFETFKADYPEIAEQYRTHQWGREK